MGSIRMVVRGGLLAVAGLLAGCGGMGTIPEATVVHSSAGISGRVHGGQQPVVGSTIQLYTVGTGADGSASTPLLTQTVISDGNGNFSITGLYSCSSATQVYLLATGGNPGAGVINPNLAMMTALGPCSGLTSSTFIMVNELTTVAAVGALSTYMTSSTAIGSGPSDASALANAFTLAGELVNTATGQSPGNNVPAGYTVPTAEMNTLADVIASCVNSAGGTAGDSSLCGQLFAATTPNGGSAPADTIGALLNLANNPTLNTSTIFGLVSATPPFQPALASPPPDFRTRLTPASSSGYVLQVEPTSLSFPATPVASPSGPQVVYLENSGTASITLGPISVTGANAGDFSTSSNCGGTLAAATSCMVTVTMTPSAAGARNAYLSVSSSSPDSPQYVSLAGSGTSVGTAAPHAMLSTGILTFPLIGAGVTENVTLSNTGNAPLSITSVSTTTPYFVTTSQCGASLAAGASCTIAVQNLAPIEGLGFMSGYVSGRAAFTDQLTVVTNDPSSPADVLIWVSNFTTWSTSNLMFPPVADSATTTLTLSAPALYEGYPLPSPTLPMTPTSPSSTVIPSFVGANASDFSVSPNCLSSSPAGYCDLTVTFTPTAMGTRTASLVLDGIGSYIPVTGTKVASVSTALTFSPPSVSLGGSSVEVTVTNPSSSTVALSSITTTPGFSQTNNCGSSLYAESVCTITVSATLSPTIAGGQQGVLTVNEGPGPQSVTLANLVNPILQFGTWANGLTTTLTRTIGGYEQLDAYGILGAGTAGLYSCIERFGECDFAVPFPVNGLGLVQSSLPVTNQIGGTSYPGPTFQEEATGVAAGPVMTFDLPDGMAATVGLSNQSYALNMYNSGTTAMTISSIAMSGANATDFTPATTCIQPLAVGASCLITFGVTVDNVGLRTATMTVTDGASGRSFSAPVSVLGLPPGPAISPAAATFPLTGVNDISAPMSFTVTSYNNAAVTAALSSTTQPSEFSLTKASCAQGESPCTITAVFNPTSAGDASAEVSVVDSNGNAIYASLSGHGGVGAVATVSPTSLIFTSRPAGSMSLAQIVTVTNTGDEEFGPVISAVSGANAGEFSVSDCSGYQLLLSPGSSCTITVTFDPTTAGNKSASFQVTGVDVIGLPITVSLSGTAF